MDGTSLLFEPFITALGHRCSVITVSYPCLGIPEQSYAALHDLAALVLPSEGSVVLLGESFSGPIAISLAAAHPKRVVGVVLCCTFVRNPRPGLRWLSFFASLPLPLPPSPLLNPLLLGRFATPKLRRMLRTALALVPPAVLRARLKAVVSVDVRPQARGLEAPVLYLKATHDRLVLSPAVTEVEQCCRNISIQAFEAPHCLLQAVPVEAAAAVTKFIDAVMQNTA